MKASCRAALVGALLLSGLVATDAEANDPSKHGFRWKRRAAPAAEVHAAPPAAAAPPAEEAPAPRPPAPAQDLDAMIDAASGTDLAFSPQAISPNMIGDFFGGGGGISALTAPGVLSGAQGFVSFPNSVWFINGPGDYVQAVGSNLIAGVSGGLQVLLPGLSPGLMQAGPPPPATIPLSPANVATIQGSVDFLTQPVQPLFLLAQQAQQQAVPGSQVTSLSAQVDSTATSTGTVTDATVTYTGVFTSLASIPVVIPAAPSYTVGVLKVAENNSPIPRDRVYFNYNYFQNTPLTGSGVNVNRMTPGFEKTFFNRWTSIDVRFPFASTLNPTITIDEENTNAQFGNVTVVGKTLLYQTDQLYIATGMGFNLPTSRGLSVGWTTGIPLARINNQAVALQPYLAGLWMPNDRLFTQVWGQLLFPTNGNSTYLNSTGAGLQRAGVLTDPSLAFLDWQIGWWVYRSQNPSAVLNGVAPLLELHYNATISDPDVVRAGNVAVGNFNTYNMLNLTAGVNLQIARRFSVLLASIQPLTQGNNRQYNWEFAALINYQFGVPTQAGAISAVSGF